MAGARYLIRAACVADGRAVHAPGVVLLEDGAVVAAGPPAAVGAADAPVTELPGSVLLPGLVNAHAHLDLSHLAPGPVPGRFVAWIDELRAKRLTREAGIAGAVRRGAMLSRAGGTAFVGDIAGGGSDVPARVLAEAGLPGVSFREVIGIGRARDRALAAVAALRGAAATDGVRAGVSPHAPYSCDLAVYEAAARLELPLATHLAETVEEVEFVGEAGGPMAEFLRRLDLWDGSIRARHAHPVDVLAAFLGAAPVVAAHANYVTDAHIERLARWRTTVAYCPRASRYFGHRGHRYRDMLAAGVNVALGTDALCCLDTPDRISVLDEMRLLHRRDGTEPRVLVRMATEAGAVALGLDPGLVSFAPGPIAGMLAVPVDPAAADPLRDALRRDDAPEWMP